MILAAWLRDAVNAFDCDQITVDHVNHSVPANAQTVVVALMERPRRVRVRSERCHRSADAACCDIHGLTRSRPGQAVRYRHQELPQDQPVLFASSQVPLVAPRAYEAREHSGCASDS